MTTAIQAARMLSRLTTPTAILIQLDTLTALATTRYLGHLAHLAARLGAMNACPAACAAALCAATMSATTGSKYDPSAVVDSGYTARTSQEPVLHRNTPSIWNLYFCRALPEFQAVIS